MSKFLDLSLCIGDRDTPVPTQFTVYYQGAKSKLCFDSIIYLHSLLNCL